MNKKRHMSIILDTTNIFLGNYNASYSGREIARLVNLSPQTVLNNLKYLVKVKIMNSTKEGRNIKYSLNKKELKTKMLLQMAEIDNAASFLDKFEFKSIINELLPLSETIIVFGSFAKGQEKSESDLDLVAIGVRNKSEFNKIKRRFPREINVEFVTWKEFAKVLLSKNNLAIEIKKDHLVYGNVFKLVDIYCS